MIVKFIGNKGGGSASASIDYLLGEDREREKARILQGNPELSIAIAENLDFKHTYTLGVLSFEEENISEESKFEIMQSFEETLLAGLEREQYNITWIEHQDKGRLELNFIIPKVDLYSGKAMNPYFDKVDRDLVDTWKNVTNHKYGLTNPNDPEKKQSHIISQNLPRDKKELSESIGNSLFISLSEGTINNRNDVIKHIESLGLEIARITPTAISIKDPENGRNIRLKGEMYEENFRYSERYTEQKRAEGDEFRRNFAESSPREREKLSTLIEAKREFNNKRYQPIRRENQQEDSKQLSPERIRAESVISNSGTNRQIKGSNYSFSNNLSSIDHSSSLAWEVRSEQLSRERSIEAGNSKNTIRDESISENGLSRARWNNLFTDQIESKSRISRKFRWSDNFEISKIKNPFDKNPFDTAFNRNDSIKDLHQVEYLYDARKKTLDNIQETEDEKRILEQIGNLIVRAKSLSTECRDAISRVTEQFTGARSRVTEREKISYSIELSESEINERKSGLNECKQNIEYRESRTNEHKQETERFTSSNLEKIKLLVPNDNYKVNKDNNNEKGFDMEL